MPVGELEIPQIDEISLPEQKIRGIEVLTSIWPNLLCPSMTKAAPCANSKRHLFSLRDKEEATASRTASLP
jgi:hypothetical protein